MFLKHRDKHSWYWLPDQREDELTIFTVWDSTKYEKGVQGMLPEPLSKLASQQDTASTPHAAFYARSPPGEYARESLEIRSIVWTRL